MCPAPLLPWLAHQRLLLALKTLAEVRRLMVPTVQVNSAEQQVNVAGGQPARRQGWPS